MKALIKVGYSCNDHCGFCHTLEVRHIDGRSAEVHRKIERAKELGHSMVVLSGGEPTIRPELLEWAGHVAELDMDFGLVTNGRMLAYPDVVEELLARRLRYVYLSLHGGTARVHDRMVRSKAFDETYGALANLSGRGLDLHVNCVVTKHNVDHLRGVVDTVLAYEDATVKFSMVEPKGGGDLLFRHLMPRVSEVAGKVVDAIRYGEARAGAGPRFVHGALPLCLVPGMEDRFDDLKTHHYWTMTEVGEEDFYPVDDLNKIQPEETCRGCRHRGPCPGLYRGYHEAFGAAELRPDTGGLRSNSFNYRLQRVVETERACPLRDGPLGVTPWDRGRHLMVRHGRRLGVYFASGRDFSDADIARIKHERGQVYVDASRKDAPDDFARDLVKLRRADVCTGCVHEDSCTGLYEPLFEDVFSQDDARVRTLLRSLEGDVLDIGCGDGPYGELLVDRARAGALRYVGVDPDRGRIERLRGRWPWADLFVAAGEELDVLGKRRFDHVFVLRSWNHLSDPARALTAIGARLKPGGWLTVVDNVAFGLARTVGQVARAERSTAAFEHFRNDSASDAACQLEVAGFEVLERRDVGPDTSNQWLLRAQRADSISS